jgi:hypothetical protein
MAEEFGWGSKLPAEVESKEFAIPPIGEYNFMVVDVEKTYAKSSGNPMLKVRLDLQGAEGCVFDNLVISENGMWKLVSFFESIGVKEKGKELGISIGDAADKAINKEGRCKIKHDTYNGKTSAKVDSYIYVKPAFDAKAAEAELPFEI